MAEQLEAVISRVSQRGDGIQFEGYEDWFNLGKNYKGPQLNQGLKVEIVYAPWVNQRGETRFYINSARIIDGAPAPSSAPTPTPVAQPDSYQGFYDATAPIPAGAEPVDRQTSIERQSVLRTATELICKFEWQDLEAAKQATMFLADELLEWLHGAAAPAEPEMTPEEMPG